MAERTGIEWTEATWNPVTGCTKVSPGCANCYIERTPPFRKAGRRFVRGHIPVQLHPERLEQPLRWRKSRRVFVCSLADLFHEDVPDEFIGRVFGTMQAADQHVFQVLTKRPQRMREFFGEFDWRAELPLPNVWLGVSVENQRMANERIPLLLETPAAVRWVSCEPLLGPLDLWPALCKNAASLISGIHAGTAIDWVVVGGESGPHARPMNIAWMEDIVSQCDAAGIKCFVKQDSGRRPGQQGRIPDELWARKEWPA